jgi:hypothetical protein
VNVSTIADEHGSNIMTSVIILATVGGVNVGVAVAAAVELVVIVGVKVWVTTISLAYDAGQLTTLAAQLVIVKVVVVNTVEVSGSFGMLEVMPTGELPSVVDVAVVETLLYLSDAKLVDDKAEPVAVIMEPAEVIGVRSIEDEVLLEVAGP